MSKKQTYKLTKSPNVRHLNVTLGGDHMPVDNTEKIEEIVDKKTKLAINEIEDWEKTKYTLGCNTKDEQSGQQNECFTLRFNTWSDEYSSVTDEWVESGLFLENDILMNTKRFKASFIRLSYFTTPHKETQKLVSYSNIPLQQRGEQIVDICPGDVGSHLYYWKSEEKLNTVDSRLYLKVEFFSSADGNAYVLSQCWTGLYGFFPIDVWNESMDYIEVILDPFTRTFHFEALSYSYDTVSVLLDFAAGGTTYAGNLELALTETPQWLNPTTQEDNRWCEMELETRRFHSLPGMYVLAQEQYGTGWFPNPVPIMRMGGPQPPPSSAQVMQVPVPTNPLPQQQSTVVFNTYPTPADMSGVIETQPKGIKRTYKRRRKYDPTYVPHDLIAKYMGGTTLNPTQPVE